jgi:hypothetical protein
VEENAGAANLRVSEEDYNMLSESVR